MLITPVGFPSAIEARCINMDFGNDSFTIRLEDGRSLNVPYEWYPRLVQANQENRNNYRLIGNGIGIHWPEIDEDISVAELLGGSY
ncbi:MAG: DUF2442 domain-containing protein [Spirochaetota bacterium]